MSSDTELAPEIDAIPFAAFLEQTPPGVAIEVTGLTYRPTVNSVHLAVPDIQLHCDSDVCQGVRTYAGEEPYEHFEPLIQFDVYVTYTCRNCKRSEKTYALRVYRNSDNNAGGAFKYGEIPAFGPPVPSRVMSLIGPDRETFLKGRRAENQGLGVGAFAYYRRVVENQKGRLLNQIARVARTVGASPDDITKFERAAKETHFSKAIEDVRDAIPESLKIRGHNPLTLLHGPRSDGLHAGTDEECLEIATDVRVILYELADRIGQALKDEQEISSAVSRLLARRNKS